MGKFPLVEDRLANELVSHSIAFGIGKQWMGMLGKDYQKIANFFESVEDSGDTTVRFIDMNSYIKEIMSEE